jgi:hypothetical protein
MTNDFQNPEVMPIKGGNEIFGRDEREYEMRDFNGHGNVESGVQGFDAM